MDLPEGGHGIVEPVEHEIGPHEAHAAPGQGQGLRIGGETKAGFYNNHFTFRHATAIPDPDITNNDTTFKGDEPAFAGEASIDLVADILPSFSIRAGYQALYFNRLTTIGNNIHPDEFIDGVADANFPLTHADVIYHGWHAGLEYIW